MKEINFSFHSIYIHQLDTNQKNSHSSKFLTRKLWCLILLPRNTKSEKTSPPSLLWWWWLCVQSNTVIWDPPAWFHLIDRFVTISSAGKWESPIIRRPMDTIVFTISYQSNLAYGTSRIHISQPSTTLTIWHKFTNKKISTKKYDPLITWRSIYRKFGSQSSNISYQARSYGSKKCYERTGHAAWSALSDVE